MCARTCVAIVERRWKHPLKSLEAFFFTASNCLFPSLSASVCVSVRLGVCRRFLPPPSRLPDTCSGVQGAHRCWNGQLCSVPMQRALFHLWPWDIRVPGNCVCGGFVRACVPCRSRRSQSHMPGGSRRQEWDRERRKCVCVSVFLRNVRQCN